MISMDDMVGSGQAEEPRGPIEPGRYAATIEEASVDESDPDRPRLVVRLALDDGHVWTDRFPLAIGWRVDNFLTAAFGDCNPRPLGQVLLRSRGRRVTLDLRRSTRGPWMDCRYHRLQNEPMVGSGGKADDQPADEIPF